MVKKFFLPEILLFPKTTKNSCNYQLSKELRFFSKRPKKLNKRQILKIILPLYNRVGI